MMKYSCQQLVFHNKVHTLRQLKNKLPGLTHSTSPWIDSPVIHRVNNSSHSGQLRLRGASRSCLHSKSTLAFSRGYDASHFPVLFRCNKYERGFTRRTTLYVMPPLVAAPSRQFKLPWGGPEVSYVDRVFRLHWAEDQRLWTTSSWLQLRWRGYSIDYTYPNWLFNLLSCSSIIFIGGFVVIFLGYYAYTEIYSGACTKVLAPEGSSPLPEGRFVDDRTFRAQHRANEWYRRVWQGEQQLFEARHNAPRQPTISVSGPSKTGEVLSELRARTTHLRSPDEVQCPSELAVRPRSPEEEGKLLDQLAQRRLQEFDAAVAELEARKADLTPEEWRREHTALEKRYLRRSPILDRKLVWDRMWQRYDRQKPKS